MKRIAFLFAMAVLMTTQVLAQTPQKLSYQAVVRNTSDALVTNTSIGMQISILQGSPTGTPVFVERHFPTTNSNGLVTLEIGTGTLVSGNFTTIDWAGDVYYLKTETDLNGGSTFTISGTSQLMSVPYALHSKTSETITGGETDPVFTASPASGIAASDVLNWNNAFGWGDHATAGYLTSYTETDPLWALSPSFGITNTIISNWNTAYGWGDHATAGYLSDFTEADPLWSASPSFGITNTTISNWNSAYSWGNHAAAGYLTSEVDGSISNEIQSLSLVSNTLSLSNGGGSVSLSAYVDDIWVYNGSNVYNTNAGYIGIGKTMPSVKLDVVGAGAFTGVVSGANAVSEYNFITKGQLDAHTHTQLHNCLHSMTSTSDHTAGIWKLFYSNGSGQVTELSLGSSGQVLKSNGMSAAPTWQTDLNNGGTLTGSGLATRIAFWDGSTSLSSNSSLFWDNTNIRLGIGTATPSALLHVYGTGTGGGNVLFAGSYKGASAGSAATSGAGTRMMWYPDKAAFRVGYVNLNQWDKDSIGDYSVAMGMNTKALSILSTAMGNGTTASGSSSTAIGGHTIASGNFSTAMGFYSTASGESSTAMGSNTVASASYSTALGLNTNATGYSSTASGYYTTASGDYSTASGYSSSALGNYSTAMGIGATASGNYSIAIGNSISAKSAYETVIGYENIDYVPYSTTSWALTDQLFVIGNGLSYLFPSNALTILKNGRLGLQTVTFPTYALELPNSAAIETGQGRAYAWATYSDGRLKTERRTIPYGLKEIMQLEPIAYFHHNSKTKDEKIIIENSGANSIGFIAQEMYKVIPEIVNAPENESTQLWSMSYEKLTPVLVKAIQEQQAIIEELKASNEDLKQRIEKLELGK